jgi:DNA polymerase-3 subunit delta'
MAFDEVLGQERACAQLADELAAGRLAHAYLFVGPKGVGRGSTALALFKALNCEANSSGGGGPSLFGGPVLAPAGPATPDATPGAACGVCPSCRRIAQGQHEDLVILAPPHGQASAQIKVEQLREMIRTLSFPPFGGGWRLVLIREAGQMNISSANVLLKTLEEPPPKNLLALTVQDPAEILPTLVSRCRRVNFTPLPDDLVAGELARRGIDPESARLRAALAAGSLGRALELDEKRLRADLEHLLEYIARTAGPARDWAFAEEVVAPFKGGERLDRQGLAELLDLLAYHYRDQAVIAAGRAQYGLLPPLSFGAPTPLEPALNAFSLLRQTQSQILGNATPELALVVLLDSLRRLGA